MNRDQILDIIGQHLCNAIDELDPAQITPDKSMKDLGANSLDIVEVVSATMRQVRIKVPRSDLKDLKNIGDLADLLVSRAEEAAV